AAHGPPESLSERLAPEPAVPAGTAGEVEVDDPPVADARSRHAGRDLDYLSADLVARPARKRRATVARQVSVDRVQDGETYAAGAHAHAHLPRSELRLGQLDLVQVPSPLLNLESPHLREPTPS